MILNPRHDLPGFLSAAAGPRDSPWSRNSGKWPRSYGSTLTRHQSSVTFLTGAPANVGCGRAAAQATAKPGCRGVGQTFRGSPAVGPDELAHLRPPRGAGAPSALGSHLLPDSPTSPWLTSPTPRSGADKRPGRPWLALPPARYARPRVGPSGHAGGGRCRTPRSAAGRRTVAFPALALEGLATHLTGKGPDELLFTALKGNQLAQMLCAACSCYHVPLRRE